MDRKKDFTIDPVNFGELAQFIKNIKSKGMRAITIIDPAIDVYSSQYQTFSSGLQQNVYITWRNSSYVQNCVNQTNPTFLCPLNNLYTSTQGTNIMRR